LADDPGQVWGWQLLLEWHRDHDQLDLAEAALKQLIRLQPEECVHLGYLAEIQLKRFKEDEARDTLARALEVAPDYPFALNKLFTIHLQHQQYQAARALIDKTRPHLTQIGYLSRLFVLSRRQKQWPSAWDQLDAVLKDPEDDPTAFDRVHAELKLLPPNLLKIANAHVIQALRSGEANINVPRFYVDCSLLAGNLPQKKLLKLVPDRSEAGSRMIKRYLYAMAERWNDSRQDLMRLLGWPERLRLNELMQQHRNWLHEESDLYGAVGYVLNTMKRDDDTMKWFSDWRERADAEPYILNNLLLCLQKKGSKQEASEVVARGMTLPKHDEVKMRFHIWAAIEHALNKDEGAARACLDAVNPEELDGYGKELMDFMNILLGYQPSVTNPTLFWNVEARLKAFMANHKKNRLMQDAARRACALAAEKLGSFKPKWWYFTEKTGPWLLVILAGGMFAASRFFSK
jgi:tetratricopeptide (TPR) repeat protein